MISVDQLTTGDNGLYAQLCYDVLYRFMVQLLQDTPLCSRLPKEKATDKHLSKYVLLVKRKFVSKVSKLVSRALN
jgi:hypothetical protein